MHRLTGEAAISAEAPQKTTLSRGGSWGPAARLPLGLCYRQVPRLFVCLWQGSFWSTPLTTGSSVLFLFICLFCISTGFDNSTVGLWFDFLFLKMQVAQRLGLCFFLVHSQGPRVGAHGPGCGETLVRAHRWTEAWRGVFASSQEARGARLLPHPGGSETARPASNIFKRCGG